MNTTQWGRKETIITPPRQPVYSFALAALSLMLTVVFVCLYVRWGLSPLERFDLMPYLRSGLYSNFRKSDSYQLLTVADNQLHARPALTDDVEDASTAQPKGHPLPVQLKHSARAAGLVYLYRGPKTVYRN